jgi:hypothetical protein
MQDVMVFGLGEGGRGLQDVCCGWRCVWEGWEWQGACSDSTRVSRKQPEARPCRM